MEVACVANRPTKFRSRHPAAYDVILNAAALPDPNERLATLSEKLSLLGWIAIKAVALIGVPLCGIYFLFLVFAPTTYTLASIKVPKDLEKVGYTGEVVRDLFLVNAHNIETVANSPVRRVDVLESIAPKIDFQIPKTTFSFRSLVEWARKARRAGDVTVTVDLVKSSDKSPDTFRALAEVEDPQYFGPRTPLISKDLPVDRVVPDIALRVLSRLDPVVGGSYKMSVAANNCGTSRDCKLDDFGDALKDLDIALTGDRSIHCRALVVIAHIFEAVGDHDGAIVRTQEAIALDPENLDAVEVQGVQYEAKGDYERAITNFRKVATANQDASFPQLDWGNALAGQRNWKDAIPHYKLAIQKWPGNTEANAKLAYALNQNDQHEEAIKSFHEVLAVDPTRLQSRNDLANAIRDLIVSLKKTGDCVATGDPPQFSNAVHEHKYAIDENDKNGKDPQLASWFHEDLSKTYAACGDMKAAREQCDIAIQSDPSHRLKECAGPG
jgi:tetratricopeptide (TPR) repeat protein